ncbi:MAG TPA: acetyl-CoA carboxylase, biotin carboxyl carrier protein, partial [Chthoniobacterales bacterium]
MKKNDLAVFKMEREGFKITLKTNAAGMPVVQTYQPVPAALAAPDAGAPAAAAEAKPSNLKEIKSPMVGTF